MDIMAGAALDLVGCIQNIREEETIRSERSREGEHPCASTIDVGDGDRMGLAQVLRTDFGDLTG